MNEETMNQENSLIVEPKKEFLMETDSFKEFHNNPEKEEILLQVDLYVESMFYKYGPRMCYDDNFYKENFYTKENLPLSKISKNLYRFKVDKLNIDDIIGAIDTTYWKSFQRGIIFTNEAIFIKSDNQPLHIYYDKIKYINFDNPNIYITLYDEHTETNDDIVIKDGDIWWIHKEFLYKFLLSVCKYLNN